MLVSFPASHFIPQIHVKRQSKKYYQFIWRHVVFPQGKIWSHQRKTYKLSNFLHLTVEQVDQVLRLIPQVSVRIVSVCNCQPNPELRERCMSAKVFQGVQKQDLAIPDGKHQMERSKHKICENPLKGQDPAVRQEPKGSQTKSRATKESRRQVTCSFAVHNQLLRSSDCIVIMVSIQLNQCGQKYTAFATLSFPFEGTFGQVYHRQTGTFRFSLGNLESGSWQTGQRTQANTLTHNLCKKKVQHFVRNL